MKKYHTTSDENKNEILNEFMETENESYIDSFDSMMNIVSRIEGDGSCVSITRMGCLISSGMDESRLVLRSYVCDTSKKEKMNALVNACVSYATLKKSKAL